jgi:hypothetical protein
MTSPLRAATVVLVVGFLVVWLIRPIGNPCPDRGVLPQGSSTSSSPSLAPPGTRTCTYMTPDGTKATVHYVPWLDWFVLALLAGLVAVVVQRAAGVAPRPARAPWPAPRADRSRKAPSARDAGDRERARRQRAERASRDRGG